MYMCSRSAVYTSGYMMAVMLHVVVVVEVFAYVRLLACRSGDDSTVHVAGRRMGVESGNDPTSTAGNNAQAPGAANAARRPNLNHKPGATNSGKTQTCPNHAATGKRPLNRGLGSLRRV